MSDGYRVTGRLDVALALDENGDYCVDDVETLYEVIDPIGLGIAYFIDENRAEEYCAFMNFMKRMST